LGMGKKIGFRNLVSLADNPANSQVAAQIFTQGIINRG